MKPVNWWDNTINFLINYRSNWRNCFGTSFCPQFLLALASSFLYIITFSLQSEWTRPRSLKNLRWKTKDNALLIDVDFRVVVACLTKLHFYIKIQVWTSTRCCNKKKLLVASTLYVPIITCALPSARPAVVLARLRTVVASDLRVVVQHDPVFPFQH